MFPVAHPLVWIYCILGVVRIYCIPGVKKSVVFKEENETKERHAH